MSCNTKHNSVSGHTNFHTFFLASIIFLKSSRDFDTTGVVYKIFRFLFTTFVLLSVFILHGTYFKGYHSLRQIIYGFCLSMVCFSLTSILVQSKFKNSMKLSLQLPFVSIVFFLYKSTFDKLTAGIVFHYTMLLGSVVVTYVLSFLDEQGESQGNTKTQDTKFTKTEENNTRSNNINVNTTSIMTMQSTQPEMSDKLSIEILEKLLGGKRLLELRRHVILNGIPDQLEGTVESKDTNSLDLNTTTLRGRIWLSLIGLQSIDAEEYVRNINEMFEALNGYQKNGEPNNQTNKNNKTNITDPQKNKFYEQYVKVFKNITQDVPRSFKHDDIFLKRVTPERQTRLLSAIAVWCIKTENYDKRSYVQGMSLWSGPLLYSMSDVEAYHCMKKLMSEIIPKFSSPTNNQNNNLFHNQIAHQTAVELLLICLKQVDPILANKLNSSKNLEQVEMILGQNIFSLGGCSPPFIEVVKLWDFHLAIGLHMHIFTFLARIVLMRDELLRDKHPWNLLTHHQMAKRKLSAKPVIQIALRLCNMVDDKTYEMVRAHTTREINFGKK